MKEGEQSEEERKQDIEEELDLYAEAGVVSPGLLKSARWMSRALWMAMTAVVVYLLFSGWGRVSETEYEEVRDRARRSYERAEALQTEVNPLRGVDRLVQAEAERLGIEESNPIARTMKVMAEAEKARRVALLAEDPPGKAEAAIGRARALIRRLYGEIAYAEHWRRMLERAEPGAHTGDPAGAAASFLAQAGEANAADRFELLREVADMGREGVRVGAAKQLQHANAGVRSAAAITLARCADAADLARLDSAANGEKDPAARREIAFAASLLAVTSGGESVSELYEPEAWLRAGYNNDLDALEKRWQGAQGRQALELLALLGEYAGLDRRALFRQVAAQERPTPERIVAVRWLARRGDKEAAGLLKSLAEGQGALAEEAAKALKKIEG